MSSNSPTPIYTVQPASPSRMPKSVYIVVFAISTLAAYWWGVNGKPMLSRHQERTSTAVVHLRDAAPAVSLDPDSIRRQVLSPENFSERMWQAATAARLREKLAVEVAADDAPDATRIAMSYADENPRTAAGWVNDLANAFAQRYRQQWHAGGEGLSGGPCGRRRRGQPTASGQCAWWMPLWTSNGSDRGRTPRQSRRPLHPWSTTPIGSRSAGRLVICSSGGRSCWWIARPFILKCGRRSFALRSCRGGWRRPRGGFPAGSLALYRPRP